MEERELKGTLCKNVSSSDSEDGLRQIEKVLAPFMRTLKKRKHEKADVLPEAHEELYLKRNPKDLLTLLQRAFKDPLELRTLMNETAELLKVVTKSKNVNLYLTDYDRGELVLCAKHYQRNNRLQRKYPIGTYVAAHVAYTKEYVISSDILGDIRFPLGIPEVPVIKSVICLPIITNVEENCIGVIELYRECSERPYDLVHLQICNALTAWMGIAVEQNSQKLNVIKEMKIQKELSGLSEMYFSGMIPFTKAISDFLRVIKIAVKAEKAAFYVFRDPVPPDSEDTLVADAYEEGEAQEEECDMYKKNIGASFVNNEPGIPGYVARTGQILNVLDAYKDYRFDRKTDSAFYRTRSVVAFPIKNENGVLAVLKLINSLDHPFFREEDIDFVESLLYQINQMCEYYFLSNTQLNTELRLVLLEKLLDFHSKPSVDDLNELKIYLHGEPQLPAGFLKFDWEAIPTEEEIVKFAAQIFLSSDILEPCFEIQNLVDFLLRVKKSYRPLPYHNIEHAFSVLHFNFNIVWRNKDAYGAAEIVAMFLAALCHDIDHPGLTNTFLSLQNDTVYKLYGEACGEAHRYNLILFFIQQTDILSGVSTQNFKLICENLKELMMGFDLAIHFQKRQQITRLLNVDSFDWENPSHRLLSQNMILVCSDNCMCFKSFEFVKKLTSAFYRELFTQGDMERSMGFVPLSAFDRNKMDALPENQLILMSVVVSPVVEILLRLFPDLSMLDEMLRQTIKDWYEVLQYKGQPKWRLPDALIRDKKERKGTQRVHVSGSFSSVKTVISESKSARS